VDVVVASAITTADGIRSPAGFGTASALIDTAIDLSGPVQSALQYADSLGSTVECLQQAIKYMDGVVALVKTFADVGISLFSSLLS
jgi:hypothetical protein